jgi:hypothetical protein
MWVVLWGDGSTAATGDWKHEEHDTSEQALAAAIAKIRGGLVANAVYSPAGVLWMSGEELLDTAEKDAEAARAEAAAG